MTPSAQLLVWPSTSLFLLTPRHSCLWQQSALPFQPPLPGLHVKLGDCNDIELIKSTPCFTVNLVSDHQQSVKTRIRVALKKMYQKDRVILHADCAVHSWKLNFINQPIINRHCSYHGRVGERSQLGRNLVKFFNRFNKFQCRLDPWRLTASASSITSTFAASWNYLRSTRTPPWRLNSKIAKGTWRNSVKSQHGCLKDDYLKKAYVQPFGVHCRYNL